MNNAPIRDHLKCLARDPRLSLETAILFSLPVSILKHGPLTISMVDQELDRRGIAIQCSVADRQLRGCVVGYADHGIIFVDGTDPEIEQRFTLAHEAAHFVADYLEPRARAERALGTRSRDVLDGRRPPTADEQVHAFLSDVPLGPHLHQMARDADFSDFGERTADALAFELLAPSTVIRSLVTESRRWDRRSVAIEVLTGRFGLPVPAAKLYAQLLYREPDSKPLQMQFRL